MRCALPPEWAPQSAMLLAWPDDARTWGSGLAAARATIAGMVEALSPHQRVVLIARNTATANELRAWFRPCIERSGSPDIIEAEYDDIWLRDTGPITVLRDRGRHFNDFRFNGWGGRFAAERDDRLCARLFAAGALGAGGLTHRRLVLEGGSIDTNGDGAILTTERCLRHGRRNPGMDRAAIEARLRDHLGAHTIHWVRHGDLAGDDTDGHIDTLARFVAHDTIIYQGCQARDDAHYNTLTNMAAELGTLRQPDGRPYRLIELPLPAAIHDPDDGHRLPAGYVNFLIANHCVLVPAFDDPADARATAVLGTLFPSRDIISVDARPLIRQHGSLHCVAMQIPAEPDHVL